MKLGQFFETFSLIVWILITQLILPPSLAHSANEAKKPNIIVLMVDDLDVKTLDLLLARGYMGQLKKHIIDRGVTFQNSFTTNSICCSSRATLLSGQYSHNHGVLSVKAPSVLKTMRNGTKKLVKTFGLSYWLDSNGEVDEEKNTLPVWLQSAGYKTAHVGKYLNGYGSDTEDTYVPPGYDDWYGLVGSSTYSMYGYTINQNKTLVTYAEKDAKGKRIDSNYQTDMLSGIANSLVAKFSAKNETFALILTPAAPHAESGYTTDSEGEFSELIRPAPRHEKYIDGIDTPDNPEVPELTLKSSVFEKNLDEKTSALRMHPELTDQDIKDVKQQFKNRAAALLAVDDLIGSLANTLMSSGTYDQTTIIFTSDNGFLFGEHHLSGKKWAYEESIRVPLMIASPFHAGRGFSNRPVINNDISPTILDLTGGTALRVMDGRSLKPLMQDPNSSAFTRNRVFIESFKAGYSHVTSATPTYAAFRDVSPEHNSLYVHYFSEAESLSGTSLGFEYYDIDRDPTQEEGVALTPDRLAIQDELIREFTKCSGQNCRDLEDLSLEDPLKGTSGFSSCIIEYSQCPTNILSPLGITAKGLNYFADKTDLAPIDEKSCLARANAIAESCDHADPNSRISATFWRDGSILYTAISDNAYTFQNLMLADAFYVPKHGKTLSSGYVRSSIQNPSTASKPLYFCVDTYYGEQFLYSNPTCGRSPGYPYRFHHPSYGTNPAAYIWNAPLPGLVPYYLCALKYGPGLKDWIYFNSYNCSVTGRTTYSWFEGWTIPQ